MAGMLSDPRVTKEIRDIWVGYLTNCDEKLGSSVAAKLPAVEGPEGFVQNVKNLAATVTGTPS